MEYSEIKELIEIFEKTDLNDMEVMLGNDRLRLNRSPVSPFPPIPPMAPAGATGVTGGFGEPENVKREKAEEKIQTEEVEEVKKADGKVITAPIVGTFYRSSAPGEEPFVKEGDTIAAGDVVCIIEAMKFMNEVNSEISGTIVEIFVQDGEFVEYGQELFRVKG